MSYLIPMDLILTNNQSSNYNSQIPQYHIQIDLINSLFPFDFNNKYPLISMALRVEGKRAGKGRSYERIL